MVVQAMRRLAKSEAEVVRELIDLNRRGVPIDRRGLHESGHSALASLVAYFGGFVRLRRRARLPPPRRRPGPPLLEKEGVLREIQRRRRSGKALACTQVPSRLRRSGERRFGSWKAAIEAAGLDYRLIRLLPSYTRAQLCEVVLALARDFPDMTPGELARHRLATTLRDRFGTFERAAQAAGLVDWPRRMARRDRAVRKDMTWTSSSTCTPSLRRGR